MATSSGQWCLDLVEYERRFLSQRLRSVTSYTAGFQSPAVVGQAMGARVTYLHAMPGPVDYLTDGRVVWVRWDDDQRVRGTRAFRGIAAAVLGLQRSCCSEEGVQALAGRLAAPPPLVLRVGLDEAVQRQTWATERFLHEFWSSIT